MSKLFRRSVSVLALSVLLGQGCTNALSPETIAAAKHIDINIWGVVDDSGVYDAALTDYHRLHPNVQINYQRLRLEEYESKLVDAMAEDRGPDIFLIHNDWTGKYLPKIKPMPASTKVAYSVVTGTVQKKQTWELRTEPTISLKDYKSQFADAVMNDTLRFVDVSTDPSVKKIQERVVGLPISIDTMALYYNKDLLNAAGIPTPPETWAQFQEDVKKLTKVDGQGTILQSAAGIGTAFNVERASDILTALMMQNGTEMADADGNPRFTYMPTALEGLRERPPAQDALEFYTDFANPAKETFTWNDKQPNSLDAFIQGKTAFFFGYSYHLAQIRSQAPKINLGITAMPQIEGNPVKNVANYWFWTVSKKAKNTDVAWNLLNFLAKPDESKKILDQAKHPAARKSLLNDQLNDEDVGVFASQVLTAETWYRGKDPKAAEDAMLNMINDVVTGAATVPNALRFGAEKISQTIF